MSLFLFPRNLIIDIPFGNSFFSSVGTSTYSFSKPSGQLQNILYKVLKLDLPIGSYKICLYNGSTGTKNKLPIMLIYFSIEIKKKVIRDSRTVIAQ
jgi:hypothetical protein